MMQALEGLRPLKASWTDLRDFAFPELSVDSVGMPSSEVNAAVADLEEEGEDGEDGEDGDDGEGISSSRQSSAGWHQPFPRSVPQFPVRQRAKGEDTGALIGEKVVRGAHVPDHLPAYPPQHTYQRSAAAGVVRSSRKRAAALATKEKEAQRVKREAASSISKSLAKIEDCADEEGVGEGNGFEAR